MLKLVQSVSMDGNVDAALRLLAHKLLKHNFPSFHELIIEVPVNCVFLRKDAGNRPINKTSFKVTLHYVKLPAVPRNCAQLLSEGLIRGAGVKRGQ